MMKLQILLAIVVATCGLVRAQDVPPPPKPQDSGPTLASTMGFIQAQIEAIRLVSYVVYGHDNKTGRDWTNSFREQATEVRASALGCRIDYRTYFTGAQGFSLKGLREIKVYPREQQLKEENAKSGHPEWIVRIEPSVFVLRVESTNVLPDSLLFLDESTANRVAEAMVRAAELCGSKALI